MNHAFRLGPISPGPPPSFAYVVALPGGKLEVRYAPTDSQGLVALREAAKGQPLVCDPELAQEAALQMLEVAPLPPELAESRAQLAYELVAGIDRAASRPDATAAFLKAAGKFWSSKAWELIAPEEQLHVAFSVGRSRLQGELSLQAADMSQPRLVLCDEPSALDRLHGLAGEARVAALVQGGGLFVELVKEPAWAEAAIEAFFRLPRIPMPERRRAGRVAPTTTQDLVLAAALLEAVVAFADLGDGTEAEVAVEAASLRVLARLGQSPLDPAALQVAPEDGLTRIRPDGAPAATPPEPGPAAGTAAEDEDAPLSPAELATMLKGAAAATSPAEPELAPHPAPAARPSEAPPEPPLPPDDDEPPLSPAELAALLKGGAAATPAPDPVPNPVPAPAAPPMEPARAAAPTPAAAGLTPVAPTSPAGVDTPPEPPSASPARAPEAGAPQAGWLARALRSIGASLPRRGPPPVATPGPAASPPAPPRATPPKAPPAGAPRARRPAAPPPPAAPSDPAVPFSAFAQALRIAVPVDPPPVPLAERDQEEGLARQLAAAALGRDRFVSFPAVAFQIIDLINAPDADARGVAGFISRDPGLAADVLAVANSVAFRGVSEAGSVREAVARLGLQEVGKVASAVSARALLVPAQAGGRPSTALFTRAVAVATAAASTALRLRGAHSDQAWLAGLLHDVGLALGASELHRLGAGGGPGLPGPLAARALERAHVEIGAAALRGWGLPQYLVEICARHHDEAPPSGPDAVDLHLVRLTSALSRLAEPEVAARAAAEIVQSAGALGFDASAVRALAADLKAAEQRAAVLVR